ncbi:hypothetical protein PN498_18220 [Oscillatoria sp. CS-180]|uniref:hypothetical protein n=1 Tax=Oscillatoria sp. CS-180 TaxID=3021720 RepID=UPI00232AAD9F|nr:hypothetical protein [Oscillatoria sp. CS-180]MDB9527935.1 hypothetical protein [Oscillatoria sp. CS-180]
MTSAQPSDSSEDRLSQLEDLMLSAGRLLTQAANLAQANARDIAALTQRVDSLTAAVEQHDRVLDYLLRREAGDIDID